jgi:hypothetical protein
MPKGQVFPPVQSRRQKLKPPVVVAMKQTGEAVPEDAAGQSVSTVHSATPQ